MDQLDGQGEDRQRARDGGRVAQAWRWFSNATVEAATAYRDLSWAYLGLQGVMAGLLIAGSRIDPSVALAPWMLIAGVVWGLIIFRILLIKALDVVIRR